MFLRPIEPHSNNQWRVNKPTCATGLTPRAILNGASLQIRGEVDFELESVEWNVTKSRLRYASKAKSELYHRDDGGAVEYLSGRMARIVRQRGAIEDRLTGRRGVSCEHTAWTAST